ncbi:beta-lactamase family protein [Aquihabitans sp. G128]|uniref:serine hydrolase domain-containing protein n=1 Tax=Aquihabitans sp. G128 TaxID=2849779 RepID=UPI001C218F47|nr:serine hydrolase domain-containing protein [Aquihabitans sp. G128]QXC62693.1 beta-lactamase family protein [Aquihabitans sp. G128]
MTEIHGTAKPGFEALRAQFAKNFDDGLERGASVAVTLHGEPVVDLWAGDADGEGTPWQQDTIVNVWSTTKTMAATSLLILADRGELDLDAPVADVWPEFAANGKDRITTAQIMGHTAGLSGWDPAIEPADLYDWDKAVSVLGAQAPWWEPGTASGYHALTQGYLEGEVVRRVSGRTIGTFFREEVAEPLGADFHIGLPESEEHRVGEMVPPGVGLGGDLSAAGVDLTSVAVRTLLSAPITGAECNTREWRAAEIPAAGGTGNARSVARVHSMLANGGTVDGVTLLSPAGVERILVEQAHNQDLVLGMKMRMGTGFGLMNDLIPLSPNPRSFFWGGWGGSIAVTDLDAGLSVAYVMNKMADGLVGDLRGAMLVFAAYQGLAEQG